MGQFQSNDQYYMDMMRQGNVGPRPGPPRLAAPYSPGPGLAVTRSRTGQIITTPGGGGGGPTYPNTPTGNLAAPGMVYNPQQQQGMDYSTPPPSYLFARSIAINNAQKAQREGRSATADLLLAPYAGQNYTQNRAFAADANDRANAGSGAQVDAYTAATDNLRQMTPLEVAAMRTANTTAAGVSPSIVSQADSAAYADKQDALSRPAMNSAAIGQVGESDAKYKALQAENDRLNGIVKGYQTGTSAKAPKEDPFTSLSGDGAFPAASKPLTADVAQQFLKQAAGDKEKARVLAKQAGYTS